MSNVNWAGIENTAIEEGERNERDLGQCKHWLRIGNAKRTEKQRIRNIDDLKRAEYWDFEREFQKVISRRPTVSALTDGYLNQTKLSAAPLEDRVKPPVSDSVAASVSWLNFDPRYCDMISMEARHSSVVTEPRHLSQAGGPAPPRPPRTCLRGPARVAAAVVSSRDHYAESRAYSVASYARDWLGINARD
ncbi:hypothetical protein EVAR_101312_1 [Eumeta japonica]|uniref:Uncharacterized protein n=1 Tax=Eumeta variegata TaxID=151549 RepID=A0A4C2AFU5_EUMVA|nr:hypothetical protein EVAR_101312_1 [Eumeta japonica]